MAGNIDFAFVFRGGANGQLLGFDLNVVGNKFIDAKLYEDAKKAKNSNRQLFSISTGAGTAGQGDLGSFVNQLMTFIGTKTGNQLGNIGACCIVGSSNGAALALALAARLKKDGAPKLSYIGVTNLTIMSFGRQPTVPLIGDLMPLLGPKFTTLSNRVKINNPLSHPILDEEDPPIVRMDSDIDATSKRNFYEKQGNRAKLVKNPPRGGILPKWWWFSEMFAAEVHGEIENFSNKPFIVSGDTDLKKHENLCEGPAFDQMLQEASEELAKFPP